MKKISLMMFSFFCFATLFGQSQNYAGTMGMKVAEFDTLQHAVQFQEIANTFERIGRAEKDQWLPFYYAALALIKKGQISKANQDELGIKAEELVLKAENLSAGNAELFILKKMIANLRMSVDPMNRYMIYGPIAIEALTSAKKIDPNNPRIILLEAQDFYYTPAEFGGSKEKAKPLFEKAISLFSTLKTSNFLEPHWGLKEAKYFLSLY